MNGVCDISKLLRLLTLYRSEECVEKASNSKESKNVASKNDVA